jgi:TIR domain/F5/8 type C domain
VEQQSRLAEQRSNKPPDFAAFVSHAKADQKKVQEIVGALEQRGFKCWVAPRDVRPGHSYGDEIIRGIERSRCFILALSKASNESPFVAREVERAISKRKPIFPLRIEDVEPSSSLELFISSTQWIDAFSDGGKQIDQLATLIAGEEEGEGAQTLVTPVPASPPRSVGWVWPAVFAAALLLGGLTGAFLWTSYGKKSESMREPASAPSTAEPASAVATPPAAPSSASAEPKPERTPQPSSATLPPPAPSLAERQPENPAPATVEPPRPHAANEDCSRSGDTTLCASSVLPAAQGNIYGPRNLTDGNDKTAWVEGSDGQGLGEFVVLEFDSARAVRGLAIRNGYDKSPDIFTKNSRVKDIELRFSSGDSIEATLKDEPGTQYVTLSQPIRAKWIELVIRSVYPGSKYSDTAINELSVDAQ